jgi:CheY-like chemotaxis protein
MKRILLAENEAPTRRSISIVLNNAGYCLEEAKNGLDALEKLFASQSNSYPIDLLLTDIFMPGMTGLELIDEIQKQGLALSIVVITGYADDRMKAQLLRRGCSHFIAKPFEPGELLECVAQVLMEEKPIQADSDEKIRRQIKDEDRM